MRRTQKQQKQHNKRKLKRKSRGTKRRHRKQQGGDYRKATVLTRRGVALPYDAVVSIPGRSGIFSIKQADDYDQARELGAA